MEKYFVTLIEGTSESAALGISKLHANLLPAVQTALDELAKEGIIDKLKKKWRLI